MFAITNRLASPVASVERRELESRPGTSLALDGVTVAYGEGATSGQNFNDFQLIPHTWLRLTVDPHLTQQFVDVSFDVVTLANARVHVANAPASVLAGGTFQALVDRSMSTMITQEAAMAGSSTPWTVPFYYSDPNGGGGPCPRDECAPGEPPHRAGLEPK